MVGEFVAWGRTPIARIGEHENAFVVRNLASVTHERVDAFFRGHPLELEIDVALEIDSRGGFGVQIVERLEHRLALDDLPTLEYVVDPPFFAQHTENKGPAFAMTLDQGLELVANRCEVRGLVGRKDEFQRVEIRLLATFYQFMSLDAQSLGHQKEILSVGQGGEHHPQLPVADTMDSRSFAQEGAVLLGDPGRVPPLGVGRERNLPARGIIPHDPSPHPVKDRPGRCGNLP